MRTVKWIGLAFLGFLAIMYLGMLLRGAPNRGALAFLAVACGAGAWGLFRSLNREDEVQNQAQSQEEYQRMAELQRQVIELAVDHQGVLTVTDVVADLGYPIDWAEHVLKSLEDGVRVSASVTDDGIIVYEFREVMHRHRRLGGTQDGARA
jgi:Tfp pilus assembly protein PilN